MIDIRDNLEKRDILISDEIFVNTIIASIPDVFKSTINALIVVSSKTDTKLTPQELISTIRAEATSYIKRREGRKESANYAGNNNFRGRGSYRGN